MTYIYTDKCCWNLEYKGTHRNIYFYEIQKNYVNDCTHVNAKTSNTLSFPEKKLSTQYDLLQPAKNTTLKVEKNFN